MGSFVARKYPSVEESVGFFGRATATTVDDGPWALTSLWSADRQATLAMYMLLPPRLRVAVRIMYAEKKGLRRNRSEDNETHIFFAQQSSSLLEADDASCYLQIHPALLVLLARVRTCSHELVCDIPSCVWIPQYACFHPRATASSVRLALVNPFDQLRPKHAIRSRSWSLVLYC